MKTIINRGLRLHRQGIVILGILVLLLVPQLTLASHAGHSSHQNGWHHAIANLAEKENQVREENANRQKEYLNTRAVAATEIMNDSGEGEEPRERGDNDAVTH